ncbi:Hypoxia-inducible factor 1-alpha inhibitor [Wickerhamomyces ciferrii]|uniref:Hypoxia-inducible factor 1-alpha inhibitor n=1 Tax=Wickerhamomyces ciferrii (strain ATCC 14091 / BCRC 22168 / CBS 111 / JCM 3599 / NBRC 0793 / NRRL Y-1031 F-60-10) TaxID=1206466 RepID=K0KB45_WICCF|nr:Hypoxia-inducible factor 1-alpha inhibitor [Wickerhamomyces ciferrii]CCH42220.1 Hypoxia-inducible factor 1-alpha inhibitor [Wickerhamomyces ciferrii]
MTKKRTNESNGFESTKAAKKQIVNEYNGFKPSSKNTKLESFNLDQINDKVINNHINDRKPLILKYVGKFQNLDIANFQPSKIIDTLHYDELLLVERKYKGGFGSGTQRIQMKFNEFMEKVTKGDEYYLTTQYVENEPGKEDEDDEEDGDDAEALNGQKDIENSEEEEGDDDDEDEEGLGLPEIPNDQFSDTDSIDMNDIHDDFDDIEDQSENDEGEGEPISLKFPKDPLYESEAIRRIQEFIQKPLTNLIKDDKLPLKIEFLKNLIPQQVNLWIGSSNSQQLNVNSLKDLELDINSDDLGLGKKLIDGGTSSGLHHDHSDNLYILVKGFKRFTLFPPSDAENLYLVGDLNKIYSSGVIDYKNNDKAPGWRKVRDDGALETEVAKWRLDNESNLNSSERDELIKLIEEEDRILNNEINKKLDNGKESIKKDPPSFSTIPPIVLHLDQIKDDDLRSKITKIAQSKWPNFFKCQKIEVLIKPGDLLYLPAGWFHEVTSYGSNDELNETNEDKDNDNTHIAINYWFAPPNDFNKTYKDEYWRQDFQRTKESCTLFKDGVINV